MTHSLSSDQEIELQEILSLAKVAEDKLKQMSDRATTIVEKHEGWYKAQLNKNLSQASNSEPNI
jgi:hypothetical protein